MKLLNLYINSDKRMDVRIDLHSSIAVFTVENIRLNLVEALTSFQENICNCLNRNQTAKVISYIYSLPKFKQLNLCTFIHTFNICTGLLELTVDVTTMNGFIAQWLELTVDLPTMNGFIAQWLELTTDLPTMNGFIAQWLELTVDLPTMNGFITQWLELRVDPPTMNDFMHWRF